MTFNDYWKVNSFLPKNIIQSFVFLTILIILNLPNIISWEKIIYPETYHFDMFERLCKCIFISIIFLSIFHKSWIAWLTLWILFVWWLPISIGTRLIVGAPINSNLIGMVLASNPSELISLFYSLSWVWLFFFISWNIFCLFFYKFLKKQKIYFWKWEVRLKLFFISLLLLAIPFISSGGVIFFNSNNEYLNINLQDFSDADLDVGGDGDLPLAFPYELPWAIGQYKKSRSIVDFARAEMKNIEGINFLKISDISPDIFILVIGESSSRKNWKLFNQEELNTTPKLIERLKNDEGLFIFKNVVAQSISTRQAVPSMLTDQPLIWPNGEPNKNATNSIVSLASKSGYVTAWLSNQAAIGRFDGVIAAYADEADTKAFLNPSSFSAQGTYDEVLIPSLMRQIENNKKSFVVMHTLGSHFKFTHRYPNNFDYFEPKGEELSEYKNSILYTDYFLENIITNLIKINKSIALIYVSDHGQGLPDKKCDISEMNRFTVDSYEVPALVWLSEEYMRKNKEKINKLKENSETPYTNSAIFQTMIDLISEDFYESERQSFLKSRPNSSEQMVVGTDQKWLNFTKVKKSNSCFVR